MMYLGNCIDSFDAATGDCINSALPWNTVSDFACAVEDNNDATIGDVKIVYNAVTDVHSFYKMD